MKLELEDDRTGNDPYSIGRAFTQDLIRDVLRLKRAGVNDVDTIAMLCEMEEGVVNEIVAKYW